jgi:hypothetical protein
LRIKYLQVLLKDLCVEDYADVGMFGIKFFLNGKWVTVVIDDRVPCTKQVINRHASCRASLDPQHAK